MAKVKEWMGLYMWADGARSKEIEQTLKAQKANIPTSVHSNARDVSNTNASKPPREE